MFYAQEKTSLKGRVNFPCFSFFSFSYDSEFFRKLLQIIFCGVGCGREVVVGSKSKSAGAMSIASPISVKVK